MNIDNLIALGFPHDGKSIIKDEKIIPLVIRRTIAELYSPIGSLRHKVQRVHIMKEMIIRVLNHAGRSLKFWRNSLWKKKLSELKRRKKLHVLI